MFYIFLIQPKRTKKSGSKSTSSSYTDDPSFESGDSDFVSILKFNYIISTLGNIFITFPYLDLAIDFSPIFTEYFLSRKASHERNFILIFQ